MLLLLFISRWVRYIGDHYQTFNRQIRVVLSSDEATRYLHIAREKKIPQTAQNPETSSHPFGHCHSIFASWQQLQLHMFSKHGYLHPAHMLTQDTHCSICLTQFHTRTRLLEHLQYKGKRFKCFLTLCSAGPSISYERARELNKIEAISNTALAHKGLRRSYAAKLAHRTPGPLPRRSPNRSNS